jgi:hypothetical protein
LPRKARGTIFSTINSDRENKKANKNQGEMLIFIKIIVYLQNKKSTIMEIGTEILISALVKQQDAFIV